MSSIRRRLLRRHSYSESRESFGCEAKWRNRPSPLEIFIPPFHVPLGRPLTSPETKCSEDYQREFAFNSSECKSKAQETTNTKKRAMIKASKWELNAVQGSRQQSLILVHELHNLLITHVPWP
jgi:hypothetical protein